MLKKLRFGVIGCGGIAQMMHIPYLNEYEQFEIVALSDMYAPVLNAVGDHYHVAARYTDYHEMLKRDDIDAVGIFHSGSHHDSVIAALDAGKHVFVEKPLAWNLREVEEIAAKVKERGKTLQVGYHKLYDPAFTYTRDLVRQMPDLASVRITVLHPDDNLGRSTHRVRKGSDVYLEGHYPPDEAEVARPKMLEGSAEGALAPLVDEVLGDRKDDKRLRLAYGQLPDSMIHQVYTLFGFLGKPERVLHTDVWRDGLSLHSVIAYPNFNVILDWQYLANLKDYFEEYAFFGNHDRIYMQMPSPYFANFPTPVIVEGGDGELAYSKRVIVSYDEAFKRELLAFYDNVIEGKKPISSIDDALEHAKFMEDVIHAAT
ncbi:MAG TPA: Gfo/Idh/MocA family oxidoreductase [Phototrophicaceae bacterium]|nr:Gfo/Idh/MocA family oxidoreductase [Phototrophicaceae bacterium]